ncbi:MAG: prolipoprotein diacylglyceryl transferase family protein [Pirellulales bacterium]
MHPVLMELDQFGWRGAIEAYAAGMVAALSIFLLGGWSIAKHRGLPAARVFVCLAAILASSLVGARLLHAAMHLELYRENPQLFWSLDLGRFAFQGAVLAALPTGWIGCRLLRMDAFRLADALAPGLALGIASIRAGCFLTGCCFGKATDLPWGVTFPTGSPAHLHQAVGSPALLFQSPAAVHPTQLYEVLAALVAAGLALRLGRGKSPTGTAFLVSAIWVAAFQSINSFFRAPIDPSSPLSIAYPLFSVGFTLAAAALLLWRFRSPGKPCP